VYLAASAADTEAMNGAMLSNEFEFAQNPEIC
jgi:hypothetical protein